MDPKTKQLVEYVEGIENGTIEFDSTDYVLSLLPKLCAAVREQDKRARHAEEERDLFSKRIDELKAEQESSWNDFEKEALDAIGDEVIGMTVNAGTDIPGMIKKVHEHYGRRLRALEERCQEAEKQRDTYKRIASIKKKPPSTSPSPKQTPAKQ